MEPNLTELKDLVQTEGHQISEYLPTMFAFAAELFIDEVIQATETEPKNIRPDNIKSVINDDEFAILMESLQERGLFTV